MISTFFGPAPLDMASSTSLLVVISRPLSAIFIVELYGPVPSPWRSCSTKPRSVCTGPPKYTGWSASGSGGVERSTFSNRFFSLMSMGLLMTSPRAPFSVCSQR